MVRFILFRAAILAIGSFSLSSALGARQCPLEPIEGATLQTGQRLDASFSQRSDGLVDIDLVTVNLVSKAEAIAEFKANVSSKLPADQCGRTVTLQEVSDRITGREWVLDSSVRARVYLCLKTDWVCCKWLKCRTCTAKWTDENIGARKTLDVGVRLVPRVEEVGDGVTYRASVIVDSVPTREEFADWEKALFDLLKLTADIFYVSSINLVDFRKDVQLNLPEMAPFELLRETFPTMPSFRPRVSGPPAFVESKYGFGLEIRAHDARPCSIAEEIRAYLSSSERFAEQRIAKVEQRVVRNGDTLWAISESFYGDGRYFLPLSQYNGLNPNDVIQPGTSIQLPTLAKFTELSEHVVRRKESLWDISRQRAKSWTSMTQELQKVGRDPNVIYPAELLSLPE